jgi:ATP-dependent RNA helicase DeaD
LTTEDRVTGLTEARAALERGRSVVVVAPPAVEHAEAVWPLVAETPGSPPVCVIVCSDSASAVEWSDGAPEGRQVHSVIGLARTQARLQSSPPEMVAGAVKDLAELAARAALKLGAVQTMVIAWPEGMTGESEPVLDTLLAEAGGARRIVLTWDPTRITGLLERHAHRAPMVGTPDVDAAGRPAPPVGPARFLVAARDRRVAAARRAIDTLNLQRPVLWRRGTAPSTEPVDAVLCLDLPSRAELAALGRLGEPTLFLTAAQLPYARSIAAPLRAVPLPTAADLAQDRAEALRTEVARVLERGAVDAELALLHPLFERYDPAEVAAALLAIGRQAAAVTESHEPAAQVQAAPRAKVWVGVGKKDRASAKDLVGALIREAGVGREEIGRIDVRESFSLVELAEGAVERAVQGLRGVTIRGRRVAVRRDRHP